MANVLVTGAGNPVFDGVYEENGVFGGKAAYLHTGGILHLFWDVAWLDWSLNIVQGPNGFYRSTGGPNLPANTWFTQPLGTAPAPTVAVMRYVSVENGNDANDGSTEALAWAAVDHAASNAVAGETVVIAPGTYRETVVADNAGTAADRIRFVGDPECLYFDNEVPGRVRITDTNASEEANWNATCIASAQNYVEWHKIWVDSALQGIFFGVVPDDDRRAYDSVITAKTTGVSGGSVVRCAMMAGGDAISLSNAYNSVATAGSSGMYKCLAYNCLVLGAYWGFNMAGVAGTGCYNCIVVSARYGFRDSPGAGTVDRCRALFCRNAATVLDPGEATNSYFYGTITVGNVNYGVETLYPTLFDLPALFGLLPWMSVDAAGSAIRQGDNTGPGFAADDVDIGRHRLRLKGAAGLDIGPWTISDPPDHPYGAADIGLLDWGIFQTTAPSIKITAEGDYTIDVPAEAGTAITITVQSKHVSAVGNLPQLVLEGSSIVTQTDTNTAADDTWELLSVTATPTVDGVLTVILRARNTAGDCYFSDIGVS